jgi:glycosyltransferase involved in cell wall biosynthesis
MRGKTIKIAYCIPSLYSVSGMERTLSIKANYFAEEFGYEIYIILTDGKNRENAFPLSDKITVINLDINYDDIWRYPLYKKAFAYSLKQIRFRRGLKRTLFEIRPDITVSMLRREINFITKIKDGSKKVGEMHFNKSNYRDFANSGSSLLKKIFAKFWMHQLIVNLKRLDKFVVLSNEDKDKWVELNNLAVIYNPLPEFPESVSECTNKVVVAAGRFVRQKGFDMLIDSWRLVAKKHPDWKLKIYGNGNKESFLNQIASNGNLESCILYDAVPNLSDKLSEGSVFAFSSRFEGFGMVITEAMACGLPPVAFACPCGPKDIINNGIDGFLTNPGDIDTLAEKINYLIENEGLRKEMGKKARNRAERFRIELIAQEWDSLFRSLL